MDDSVEQQRRNDVVRELLRALDEHAPGELAHAHRVAVYAVATGERMGLPDEELVALRYAATLHDVGKVRVDRELLAKVGDLTDDDIWEMRLHALFGERVLESIDFLASSLAMIRHHHERWDGEGYPFGLKGDQIPIGSRIIAVAEAYDAIVNAPRGQAAMEEAEAIEELRRCSGSQFDPDVVEALAQVHELIQPVQVPG